MEGRNSEEGIAYANAICAGIAKMAEDSKKRETGKMRLFWEKVCGMYRSWVIWFNGICLASIPVLADLKDFVPQIQDYIDDHLYKYFMLSIILLTNIALRFKTDKGLDKK